MPMLVPPKLRETPIGWVEGEGLHWGDDWEEGEGGDLREEIRPIVLPGEVLVWEFCAVDGSAARSLTGLLT